MCSSDLPSSHVGYLVGRVILLGREGMVQSTLMHACDILDSNGAACRAAPVGSLNFLRVVVTIYTDYKKDGLYTCGFDRGSIDLKDRMKSTISTS